MLLSSRELIIGAVGLTIGAGLAAAFEGKVQKIDSANERDLPADESSLVESQFIGYTTTENNLSDRVEHLIARIESNFRERQRLEEQVLGLQARVSTLEKSLARDQSQGDEAAFRENSDEGSMSPMNSSSQGLTQSVLVMAGIEPDLAAEIVNRQGAVQMKRLELRDLATREGWFGTDRYFEELADVNADATELRDEIGDDAYDRYLYAAGRSNRVSVSSVIPNSPADQAGFQPGDIIYEYGETRIFDFAELRAATAQGARNEPVAVKVRRNDLDFEFVLPRGPLGVGLDPAAVSPADNS